MFLIQSLNKLVLVAILALGSQTLAQDKINIHDFVQSGSYKLVSGPREMCDKLAIDPTDLKDPFFIGAKYSFQLKDSFHSFPSEDKKNCSMNRRDTVKTVDSQTLLLRYDREENCGGKTTLQQRTEARLSKGTVEITDTVAQQKADTCVWKLKTTSTKEKK